MRLMLAGRYENDGAHNLKRGLAVLLAAAVLTATVPTIPPSVREAIRNPGGGAQLSLLDERFMTDRLPSKEVRLPSNIASEDDHRGGNREFPIQESYLLMTQARGRLQAYVRLLLG